MTKTFVISCEYATCAVPEAYREVFDPVETLVTSPAGWDSGALNLAQGLATKLRTQLAHGSFTRLLIDLDRDGEARWSEHALRIPEPSRLRLAEREEGTYRQVLRDRIADEMKRNELVLHLSVRTMDWSPGRVEMDSFAKGSLGEGLAEAWHRRMLIAGLDAGHCMECGDSALAAELGGMFPPDRYGLVRLKVAQSFFLEGRPLKWEAMKKLLLECLSLAIGDVEEALDFLARQAAEEARQAEEAEEAEATRSAAAEAESGGMPVEPTPGVPEGASGSDGWENPPSAPLLDSAPIGAVPEGATPPTEAAAQLVDAVEAAAEVVSVAETSGEIAPVEETAVAPAAIGSVAEEAPPQEAAAPARVPDEAPARSPTTAVKKSARKRTRKKAPARKSKTKVAEKPAAVPVEAAPPAEPPAEAFTDPPAEDLTDLPEEPGGQRLLF